MAGGTRQRGYHSHSGIPMHVLDFRGYRAFPFGLEELAILVVTSLSFFRYSPISSYALAVENFGLQHVESAIQDRSRCASPCRRRSMMHRHGRQRETTRRTLTSL